MPQSTINYARRQRRFAVASLQGLALCLLGLHLFVRTLPGTTTAIPEPDSAEAAWWGLWPATYLPLWTVAGGVLLVVGPILLWWWVEIKRHGTQQAALRAADTRAHARAAQRTTWLLALVSVLLCVAFFLLPVAHTRWGDAFMLAHGIAFPDPTVRLTHSWQAPIDVFLHSQLWLLLNTRFGWTDAIPAYRLLSPLAGAL